MKGSIFDMAGILMYILVTAVILFAVFFLITEFKTVVSGIPMVNDNDTAMDTIDAGENVLKGMDGLFAFSVFMTCLLVLISAYLAPSHPILFIGGLLMVIILIPISAEFANMFELIYDSGPMAGVEANFPITLLIMQWLPKITLIMSLGTAVVMYMFGGRGFGGGGGVGY